MHKHPKMCVVTHFFARLVGGLRSYDYLCSRKIKRTLKNAKKR